MAGQRASLEVFDPASGVWGIPRGAAETKLLTEAEQEQVAGGKLIGDRAAELFAALGFPPCNSCSKRKEWLNKAHTWLLGKFGGRADQ